MSRLRHRINRAGDSYYVAGEGYKQARKRMHDNQVNLKMNVLVLFIGAVLLIGYFQLRNINLLYWGIGVFAFGCLTTWLTYRNRKYE